jgi:hypothetical protein
MDMETTLLVNIIQMLESGHSAEQILDTASVKNWWMTKKNLLKQQEAQQRMKDELKLKEAMDRRRAMVKLTDQQKIALGLKKGQIEL